MKKMILSRVVIMFTAVMCIAQAQAQKKPAVKTEKRPLTRDSYLNIENDSMNLNGDDMVTYREGSQHYKIRMKDDKVVEMYVNDQRIPEPDFDKYKEVIGKIRVQIKKDKEQAEIDRQQALRDQAEAVKDQEQAEKDEEQAKLEEKEAQEERVRSREDAKQAELDRKQAIKDIEQARLDQAQAMKDMEQAKLDRKQAEEDRRIYQGVVADLISGKIIRNEDELHELRLTNTELIVNGATQSDNLHQKLRAKYLNASHTQVIFRNNANHRMMSVEKKEEQ